MGYEHPPPRGVESEVAWPIAASGNELLELQRAVRGSDREDRDAVVPTIGDVQCASGARDVNVGREILTVPIGIERRVRLAWRKRTGLPIEAHRRDSRVELVRDVDERQLR